MKITRDMIEHIAALTRMNINDDNAASIEKDMSEICQFFEKLRELDTTGISPTEYIELPEGVMRNDAPIEGLSADVVMSLAPEKLDSFFKTPPAME